MPSPIFQDDFAFKSDTSPTSSAVASPLTVAPTSGLGYPTTPRIPLRLDLPSELWLRIFSATISQNPTGIDQDNASKVLTVSGTQVYPPWNLREVCRRWRYLIVGSATFWNHIRVTLKTNLEMTYDARESPEIEARIQDMQALFFPIGPISIEINSSQAPSECACFSYGEVTAIFKARLRGLCIIQHPAGFRDFLTQLPTFQALETLVVELYESEQKGSEPIIGVATDSEEVSVGDGSTDPDIQILSLKSLAIAGGLNTLELFPSIPTYWNKLTHFYINFYDADALPYGELLAVLEQCNGLVFLAIRSQNTVADPEQEETDDTWLQTSINLPSLQYLFLDVHNPLQLRPFVTPALEQLSILRYCEFPLQEIVAFVDRSACSIERFYEGGVLELVLEDENDNRPAAPSVSFDEGDLQILGAALPDVDEIWTSAVMSKAALELVARGEIFPRLSTFNCSTEMAPEEFITALEPRLGWKDPKHCSFSGLKKVRCQENVDEKPGDVAGAEEYFGSMAKKYDVELNYEHGGIESSDFETFYIYTFPEIVRHLPSDI